MSDPDPTKVFVVHGRNAKALEAVKALLRAVRLHPLEWEEARQKSGKPTPYIWEIVEAGFDACQTALVILSGDELAVLRDPLIRPEDGADDKGPSLQSRPNVFIEMGAALARGQNRVVLAQIGPHRTISDIGGRHLCRLNSNPGSRKRLIERLKTAGAEVVDSGEDYLSAGDFDAATLSTDDLAPDPGHAESTASRPADDYEDVCPAGSVQEEILLHIFRKRQERVSQICRIFELNPEEADYYLEEMRSFFLIDYERHLPSPDPVYWLMQKGKRIVMTRGLNKRPKE